jgi:hypothetical protein
MTRRGPGIVRSATVKSLWRSSFAIVRVNLREHPAIQACDLGGSIMNRLSLAFFAAALLLVSVAVAALFVRAGEGFLLPVPAVVERAPAPSDTPAGSAAQL